MTLIDELLKADRKKVDDLRHGIFKSQRLADILEVTEKVEVDIREIPARRINDIASFQFDRKGNLDFSKTFDAKLMTCIEGIVNPDVRNKELQEHFGCSTAKDLVEKLFGSEVGELSDEISKISGIVENEEEDQEKEIKN